MKSGIPIEISGLSKRFGAVTAVDDLSFTVEPGRVTGFLGPNGAGKTTTLRVLLGLVRATAGTATFGGTPYRDLRRPLETVGAALDANFHPGRSARNHLKVYATAAGLPGSRVPVVLEQVGLDRVRRPPRRRLLARHAPAPRRSRTPCSATPACSCSTSRSTASTPRASSGSAASCSASPTRAAPCW